MQVLRVCSDVDVVQPLVHIANPSIASAQRVGSNITNTQLRTSSIAIHRSAHQASQRHSESSQRLRAYSDIAVVQLLAHIANPSIASTQRISSNVASAQLHAARIANTEVHIKHSKNTASQLKDCECTAILLYSCLRTSHIPQIHSESARTSRPRSSIWKPEALMEKS